MTALFEAESTYQPLASRMRPTRLEHYVGQEHLLGIGKPLRESIESSMLHSMVLWGPPGVGKTTLAKLIAEVCDIEFQSVSAVLAGVKDIRGAISIAEQFRKNTGRKTLLFVDEVHRFNKAQQDAFLPYVEDGTVIFAGATTENPSFELNNALLSRARIYKLLSLTEEHLVKVLEQALDRDAELQAKSINAEESVLQVIAKAADGDARRALNILEVSSDMCQGKALTDSLL